MTTEQIHDSLSTIKAFLEADAKRTQGEWEHAPYDGNVMTSTPTVNGRQHVADTRKSTEGNKIRENANFIALASTLAPAIRTMLADIEMAREALEVCRSANKHCMNQTTQDAYNASRAAISALDKYKPKGASHE